MNRFLLFLSVLLVLLILTVMPVLASSGGGGQSGTGGGQSGTGGGQSGTGGGLPNPLRTDNVLGLIERILREVVTKIAPPIVGIMIIVGAFQMLFAGGDPEKFSTGKKTIVYAVVGFLILLISLGIVYIIEDILGFRVR